MNDQTRRRRRRGTLLVEMLFAIFLVSVTILIAARLLRGISRVYRDSPVAADALRAQSQWLQLMRDDAWAARNVDAKPGNLKFDLGERRAIVWTTDGAFLRRADGDVVQRWPDARALRWTAETTALVLNVADVEVALATPSVERAR